MLEVLPILAPGVVVQFHDIFRPFEYPRILSERLNVHWQEHYLLQAFLAYNPRRRLAMNTTGPPSRPAATAIAVLAHAIFLALALSSSLASVPLRPAVGALAGGELVSGAVLARWRVAASLPLASGAVIAAALLLGQRETNGEISRVGGAVLTMAFALGLAGVAVLGAGFGRAMRQRAGTPRGQRK